MSFLSILLPVYNQIELVKKNVEIILKSKRHDIELVVCDDCSSENIESFFKAIDDSRVTYYRNEVNLGHDYNILKGLKKAKSDYVFLLRTRDLILVEAIDLIISTITLNPDIAYLTGSAIDENGNNKLIFNEKIYKCGIETLRANRMLFIHPSGQLYNKRYIDFNALELFLNNHLHSKYGFVVHNLIRTQLALKGDFIILSDFLWQYTNTSKCKDIAVNSAPDKMSVYSYEYEVLRFSLEFDWVNLVFPETYKEFQFEFLLQDYLKRATWGIIQHNNNKEELAHYDSESKNLKFSQLQQDFTVFAYQKIGCITSPIKENLEKKFKIFILNNNINNRLKYYIYNYLVRITGIEEFVLMLKNRYNQLCIK